MALLKLNTSSDDFELSLNLKNSTFGFQLKEEKSAAVLLSLFSLTYLVEKFATNWSTVAPKDVDFEDVRLGSNPRP